MKKWMKMTATMMVAAMALTACGGNDAADDSADAGETYTVSSWSTLHWIRQQRALRIS
mgnify:CR=1 FL=1